MADSRPAENPGEADGAVSAPRPSHPAEPPPSVAISAAAAIAAVGAAVLVVQALGPEARATGSGLVTYLLMAAAVEGACAVGFRLRRRWAFAAYLSFFPLHQLILAAVATWSPAGFLLRLAAILLAFFRLSRLR